MTPFYFKHAAGSALTFGLAIMPVYGAYAQTPAAGQTVEQGQLAPITVRASADASASGLAREYAGGQVARGGRVGILGAQDVMETPFSITSYTNTLIQSQQARSVADVVQNDPSVRTARGFGNFQETYFIRGFLTTSDDIAYNGLYGLLPRQYTAAELAERVEILRGAGAFLYGAAPSGMGIGGTINVMPKRAGAEPLNQVTVGTGSGSQLYTAADFSRRFGPDQNTGIRINLARRDGGTGIDDENATLNLATVGLDWRNDRVRLSADIGYQENRLRGIRPNVTLGAGVDFVPDAPDSTVNFAQPWTRSNERDVFGTIRGEVDLDDAVTVWAAAGMRQGKEFNTLAGATVNDPVTGAGTASRFDNRRQDDVKTGEIGVRANLATGSVEHKLVAAVSYFEHKEKNAVVMDFLNLHPINIYDPIYWDRPALDNPGFIGGDVDNPGLRARTRLTSFTLGDTLSFWDDKVNLTLGLRHQRLQNTEYDYWTEQAEANPYDDSRTSPVVGVVYKINDAFSVYANYIESLARGDTAPSTYQGRPVTNAGSRLAPYVSKQQEIGIKYDGGRLGGSLALFSTKKPHAHVGPDLMFSVSGEDRHRGAELSVYGEISPGLRLLGGVTLLDAKQRSTGDAATDGKYVIGVPKRQASLGVEWDVPSLEGMTLSARAIATGSRYADAANTLRSPGWVRYDLGASYIADLPGDKTLTVRTRIENVADRNYWSSVGGYPGNGYLVLGAPRTVMLNASLEF